ncbi:hypothetical protein [Anaeromyxobacter dehalogenans]|uniref:hypothetical protein n=1 Tax=Anaeromyxobacter dehalogenans TaxID=161493 RepID=UPI000309B41E|nr:hypothetical protein [Anaeromyxobacter dehalogenans]
MIELVTTLLLAVGVYALLRRPDGHGCGGDCGRCGGEPGCAPLVQLERPRGGERR